MSSVLEVVFLNVGEDWVTIGKCAQLCQRNAVHERFGGLYDTERSRASRESGKCVICGKKAALNTSFNCVVHKQCLRNHLQNEHYMRSDDWLSKWSSIAPFCVFGGYRGVHRKGYRYKALWKEDNGIVAPRMTTNFFLKARAGEFAVRKAAFKDRVARRRVKRRERRQRRIEARKATLYTFFHFWSECSG